MRDHHPSIDNMCIHCGAVGAARLGTCSVCTFAVCDKCGNIQHVRGEKRATHNDCLKHDDAGFSMIKFVK